MRIIGIQICDACYDLKEGMCHNPDCVFCRCTKDEVEHILNVLTIRPKVNGEALDLYPKEKNEATNK